MYFYLLMNKDFIIIIIIIIIIKHYAWRNGSYSHQTGLSCETSRPVQEWYTFLDH